MTGVFMKTSFWRKISYGMGYVVIGILLGLAVFQSNLEIKDLDLWLHIATGRFIVENGYVPSIDVLSYSIQGKPWINHEWVFQVLVYWIYQAGGADALLMMQAMVVAVTLCFLLLIGYSRERQILSVFLLLIVVLVYQMRFTIRPDIFSLLFFTLTIYIMSGHLDKRWSLYALFLIQVLWTNFHGFFFLGPLIILWGILDEFVKRHIRLPFEWNNVGRLTDGEYKRLKQIFGVVILACLFNPLTFEGAWYPIKVMVQLPSESKIFFEHIQELQRPVSLKTIFALDDALHYKLLIYFSALSFIFNFRMIDIGVFVFWLFFLAFSLMAKRNLVFFAFAAYLVCITNLMNIRLRDIVPLRFTHEKFRHMTSILFKIILCFWMIQYGLASANRSYFDFDTFERKSEFWGVSLRTYPNKAADFLIDHQAQGNFFNDFNSGAYLLGRCFPRIKVFIDGRTEVYGADFFRMYKKMWAEGDKEFLDKAIEQYHITGALLNSIQSEIPGNVLKYFFKKEGWAMVYFDYDAVIFLKDIPQNRKIIERFRIDLSQWKPPKMDLKRLGARNVTPFPQTSRAYTLEVLGFDEAALIEAQEALKMSPAYLEPYKIMGKIFGKRKEYEKAFENFRIATMLSPFNREVRYNLALAYSDLGDWEGAVKQYKRIIQFEPNNPKGYFHLSKAYAKRKEYKEALEAVGQAHRLDSSDVVDLLKIGDIIYEQGDFKSAQQVYEMALATGKDQANIHNKLGLCFQSLKQPQEAKDHYRKGLAIDPHHSELKENLRKLEIGVEK